MKTTAATISEGKSHQSSQVSTSLDTEHLEILKNLFAFGLKNHDAINCNFCSQRSPRSLCLSSPLSFKHCGSWGLSASSQAEHYRRSAAHRTEQFSSLCTSHVHNPQSSLATSLCPQAMTMLQSWQQLSESGVDPRTILQKQNSENTFYTKS